MMIWDHLKYFTKEERNYRGLPAWGDPGSVNGYILLLLDAIRGWTDWPVIIHCAYETSSHTENSYHYKGWAVDFHFKTEIPYSVQVHTLAQILEELQVSDVVGLGIYPEWNNKGFHLDCRGYKARWGQLGGKYVSFEQALIEA